MDDNTINEYFYGLRSGRRDALGMRNRYPKNPSLSWLIGYEHGINSESEVFESRKEEYARK